MPRTMAVVITQWWLLTVFANSSEITSLFALEMYSQRRSHSSTFSAAERKIAALSGLVRSIAWAPAQVFNLDISSTSNSLHRVFLGDVATLAEQ